MTRGVGAQHTSENQAQREEKRKVEATFRTGLYHCHSEKEFKKVLPVLTAMLTLFLMCKPWEDCVSMATNSNCFSDCRALLPVVVLVEQGGRVCASNKRWICNSDQKSITCTASIINSGH